jgi:pyruvate kinase
MGDSLDHLANRTKLEWTCNLNTEFQPKRNYRRTSIICTIGEAEHYMHKTSEIDHMCSRPQDELS